MNKNKFVFLLLTTCIYLTGCSNKDAEQEAEILTRPIVSCDGMQAADGRAYVDGNSLHIQATVTAPRKISTYRLHESTKVLPNEPSVEVYELRGFFGQDYEKDEYISQIDVQMALSDYIVPGEIVIVCREGSEALIRITLDR